jgi:DNA-binding CsgD family transcriptional regulator
MTHNPPSLGRELRNVMTALGIDADEAATDIAAPLGQAMQNLLIAHEDKLRRARAHGAQLAKRYQHSITATGTAIPIELVRGDDAIGQRVAQLRQTADQLIRCLLPTPTDDVLAAVLDDPPIALECRVIYPRGAVDGPGALPATKAASTAGYQARVLPSIATSLVIVDDMCAVLPQGRRRVLTPGVLVIQPCSLLEALTEFFDRLWQRAIPLELPVTTTAQSPRLEQSAAQNQRIMALLLSGLTDDAIARQLGLSLRTVQRRIAALMHGLGARTRFQAGVQAALRDQPSADPR